MYRVILVDDEIIDLNGLKTFIPWHELDLDIIKTFNNSFDALDFLKHEKVDILITDIKMPIMSGLELFRKAQVFSPELKVVFISGYESFEYAKSAIKMNAGGYVLKPVDEVELINVLKIVIDQLKEEERHRLTENNYKNYFPLVKNEIIRKMLEEGENKDKNKEYLEQIDIDWDTGPFFAAIIEVDNEFKYKHNKNHTYNYSKVLSKIQTRINTWNKVKSCQINDKRIALIFNDSQKKAIHKLNDLLNYIRENTESTITIGVGFNVDSLLDIYKSYKRAVNNLEYKMTQGKDRIIITDDITRIESKFSKSNIDDRINDLNRAIVDYKLTAIINNIDDIFKSIKQFTDMTSVYNIVIHILFKTDEFLKTLNESLSDILEEQNKDQGFLYDFNNIFHFETMNEVKKWFYRQVFEISEYLYSKGKKADQELIQTIKDYVYENIANKLTLKDVANFFSYSPNYLGRIFKEHTNENFNDFLIRTRMRKASELLKETDLYIYQIVDMIGYKNMTYFNRIFKKYYGITPGKYRKQSRV